MNNQSEIDREVARFALFSLFYVQKSILINIPAATKFYRKMIRDSKIQLQVNESDIPQIIYFARQGENWLERFVS